VDKEKALKRLIQKSKAVKHDKKEHFLVVGKKDIDKIEF